MAPTLGRPTHRVTHAGVVTPCGRVKVLRKACAYRRSYGFPIVKVHISFWCGGAAYDCAIASARPPSPLGFLIDFAQTGGMTIEPTPHTFAASAARIAYVEWGEPGGQPVLLIHATGFHARVWDQTVKALGDGFHVFAVDVRGHGQSEKKGAMPDWTVAAHDIGELVEHLNLKNVIGAGHSMGGHVLVQVAAEHQRAFKRLVLVDPVMLPPEVYANPKFFAMPEGQVHPVAKRRNAWASWEAMFDAFKSRAPYSLWNVDVLADYCRYGLVPAANGQGFELACPPEIEASIYTASAGTDIYAIAARVNVPVVVLRAKPRGDGPRDRADFSASPTWEGAARAFTHGRDVQLFHLTHFIPMEDPALTARFIADEHAVLVATNDYAQDARQKS